MISLSIDNLPRVDRSLTPSMEACILRYQSVLEKREVVYARVREEFAEKIQCSPLCNECCTQIFLIRMMDWFLVHKGFQTFSPCFRKSLQQRAKEWMDGIGGQSFVWVGQRSDLSALGEVEDKLPTRRLLCPFVELLEGCQLYPYRPAVCRSYGYPQMQSNGTMASSCHKNLEGISSDQMSRFSIPIKSLIAVEECKQEMASLLGVSEWNGFAVTPGLSLPILFDPVTIDWARLFEKV